MCIAKGFSILETFVRSGAQSAHSRKGVDHGGLYKFQKYVEQTLQIMKQIFRAEWQLRRKEKGSNNPPPPPHPSSITYNGSPLSVESENRVFRNANVTHSPHNGITCFFSLRTRKTLRKQYSMNRKVLKRFQEQNASSEKNRFKKALVFTGF